MAIKYIKKCSACLEAREMHMKTALRFHFIPVRLAIIKKTKNNVGKYACGGRVDIYTAGGNLN
jgi:hypothetical protein